VTDSFFNLILELRVLPNSTGKPTAKSENVNKVKNAHDIKGQNVGLTTTVEQNQKKKLVILIYVVVELAPYLNAVGL